MPHGHACKSYTDKTISVKVGTNSFSSFVSTMSKFSTDVTLLMGQNKLTGDGVIVFEMNCDNEENNIFSVRRCDVQEKIKHLYGSDYTCRCYCVNKLQ
jgi:hypothetical protein